MNPIFKTVSAKATNFIRTDHRGVKAAFRACAALRNPQRKRKAVEALCLVLINHTRLEEEIFYPAVRDIDEDLVERSIPEHAELARLIALIRRMEPVDAQYGATLEELRRKVMAHVEEEERELLPKVDERMDPDRNAELGARMSGRRIELYAPLPAGLLQQAAFALPSRRVVAAAAAAAIAGFIASRTLRQPAGRRTRS